MKVCSAHLNSYLVFEAGWNQICSQFYNMACWIIKDEASGSLHFAGPFVKHMQQSSEDSLYRVKETKQASIREVQAREPPDRILDMLQSLGPRCQIPQPPNTRDILTVTQVFHSQTIDDDVLKTIDSLLGDLEYLQDQALNMTAESVTTCLSLQLQRIEWIRAVEATSQLYRTYQFQQWAAEQGIVLSEI